jgi:hypothetical protein
MSWAIDEVSSFYDNTNFTMQWCLLGESLYHSFHSKGNHGYGGIWGGMGASFHHNLIADNTSRNPRFCGARYHIPTASSEIVDFRNNVIFNWGGNSIYGGEGGQQNIVNNYFKPGPATIKKGGSQLYRIVNPSVSTDPKVDSLSKWYLAGNYMEGNKTVTDDNVNGGGFQPQYSDPVQGLWEIKSAPFAFAPVATQSAEEAFESVLAFCGASLVRDAVDKRIIYQARTGSIVAGGTFGANTGIIDSPTDVGGWPVLNSTTPPTDSDHDGMPDEWENTHGLNPNNAEDRNYLRPDGYTQLEGYLNSLTGEIITSVAEYENNSPIQFTLYQNFPNPFNPTTTISFDLPNSGPVSLKIYDTYGREISTLMNAVATAGKHQMIFNGEGLPSGVYFARLKSSTFTKSIKLVLAK